VVQSRQLIILATAWEEETVLLRISDLLLRTLMLKVRALPLIMTKKLDNLL
jgi:hypothetical protein